MDPNNRLADLITITGRLTELLRRENDALQNRRTKEVHELLDEKAALSRVYETRFNSFVEKPELLQQADPALREELGTLAAEVDGLMHENAKLLRAAIEVNQRVVDLIAEAVRDQQRNAGTYTAGAVTNRDGTNAAGQRVVISLDQTL